MKNQRKFTWIDTAFLGGSLAGLAVMATVSGCYGPTTPPPDNRAYIAFRSGPGGNPLAVFSGGTAVTPIPITSLNNQSATGIVAASINNAAPRLYATIDGTPGRLVVVNTTGNALLATVNVGNQPTDVALNADATRAYVTNSNPNPSLTVVNLANNTVAATVALPAGSEPIRVRVDPTGDAWVLTRGVNTVTVVDGNTNAIESTINVNQPQEIAIHPNGQQVYVANGSNSLTVIDAATRTIAATAPIAGIQAVAAARAQDLLAVCEASPTVADAGVMQFYDAITLTKSTAAPSMAHPNGGFCVVATGPISLVPATAMVGSAPSILTPTNTLVSVPNTRASDVSFVEQITQTAPTQMVLTDPPGLRVRVDGTEVQTPAIFSWAVGTNHTLTVTSPQAPVAGTRHLWESWSNGGALSQTVTAVSGATTYTAKFKTQHEVKTASAPANGGTVSLSPTAAGNFYDVGTIVTATATPAANFLFGEWRDDLLDAANPGELVISKPSLVTAAFDAPPALTLSVVSRGPGSLAGDGYSHTANLRNTSTETYTEVRVNTVVLTVNQGTGAISNTTSLPILVGTLGPNTTSANFVFTGSIPTTITRWNFTLTGTVRNAAGRVQPWTRTGLVIR